MKISYRDKTLRLRRETGGNVQPIYAELMNRMTGEKSTLTSSNKDASKP